jgi:hypothetical protein
MRSDEETDMERDYTFSAREDKQITRKFGAYVRDRKTEGKTRIEDEEIADRWQQYIEELNRYLEKLEELERKEEITPKNWVQL